MATWKRLTASSGGQIDVNMDQVCFIVQHTSYATLCFSGGRENKFLERRVKETADAIHKAKPLHSL